MFTIQSALATHMAQDVASLAFAIKITPIGVTTPVALTTAPVDCTLSGILYSASAGVTPSSLISQLGMTPGKIELSGFLDSGTITEVNIHAGIYDFADVEIYVFNWQDTTQSFYTLLKGKVSDIQLDGRQWTLEVSDLIDQLSINIVELTSASCRADLFDSRCKVTSSPATWAASTAYTLSGTVDAAVGSWVKPTTQNRRWFRCSTAGTSGGTEPTWNTTVGATTTDGTAVWTTINAFVMNGSVTSKTSNQVFADSSITEATNFFQFGKIVWLTGANAGFSMEIKSQTATVLELYLPMVNTVAVGDTFTIYAGCDKSKTACKTKFFNIYNMRGEPDKPSVSLLSQFGKR